MDNTFSNFWFMFLVGSQPSGSFLFFRLIEFSGWICI